MRHSHYLFQAYHTYCSTTTTMASSLTKSHTLKRKRRHSDGQQLKLGLEDLFSEQSQSKEQQHVLREPTSCTTTTTLPLHHQQEQEQEQQEHIIPTFRLEHRQGGLTTTAVATRGDEEQRLLLFRSDRAGAIAKIIFSIDNQDDMTTTTAKIHSLFVKPEFRGCYDLGGMLVTQALQCLQSQAFCSFSSSILYLSLDAEEDTCRHNQLIQFYQQFGCRVKKTAKPLYLYHNDGEMYRKVPMELELKNVKAFPCWVPPPYQKFLPITISSAPFFFSSNGSRLNNELRDFEQEKEESCRNTSRRKANHHWMLVETTTSSSRSDDDKHQNKDGRLWFELHTTRGAILMAQRSNGSCQLVSLKEQECHDNDNFNLEPFRFEFVQVNVNGGGPTSHPTIRSNSNRRRNDERDDDDDVYCPMMQSESDPFHDTTSSYPPKRKLSWCLRSTHGLYLSLSPHPASSFDQQLECSFEPIVWYSYRCRRRSGTQDSNNEFESYCLECSGESLFDTPEHQQTLDYVESMHAKYLLHDNLGSTRTKLTIEEALDMAGTIPAFGKDCGVVRGPSLRTLCYHTAEAVRAAGHPDWVQFVALVHTLGGIVQKLEEESLAKDGTKSSDDTDFLHWSETTSSRSKIIDNSSFSQTNSNPSWKSKSIYSQSEKLSYASHCGIRNTTLSWSGQEYLYHMLQFNNVAIPDEGYAILRLFGLSDWHSKGWYQDLEDEDDQDVKEFVREFDELRLETRRKLSIVTERSEDSESARSEEKLNTLYKSHYADICRKYGADGSLSW